MEKKTGGYDKGTVLRLKGICGEHVGAIFRDLEKEGLLAPDDADFPEFESRSLSFCFKILYPLAEYLDGRGKGGAFFRHNCDLFVAAEFLDDHLDGPDRDQALKTRSVQIALYLLLRYFEWLVRTFDRRTVSRFFSFYRLQTDHLILEKKWDAPSRFISGYGRSEDISRKGFMLSFPLELLDEMPAFGPKKAPLLKKIFKDYSSYIQLVDDLIDLDEDIKGACLTYPIVRYYRRRGAYPKERKDMAPLLPEMMRHLNAFEKNIDRNEEKLGKRSLIIKNKILSLKMELMGAFGEGVLRSR